MDNTIFNPTTHRLVEYKGKPVAIPLMVYWRLSAMKQTDTVVIQLIGSDGKDRVAQQLPAVENTLVYQRVNVSELTEFDGSKNN